MFYCYSFNISFSVGKGSSMLSYFESDFLIHNVIDIHTDSSLTCMYVLHER
jgi:hypothetical protein